MKYKKYSLFFLLVIILNINSVYADNMCYYISNGFSARYNLSTKEVLVDKASMKIDDEGDSEDILNLNRSVEIEDWTIPAYTNTNKCPNYLIISYDTCVVNIPIIPCIGGNFDVYATDNETDAIKAAKDAGHENRQYGFYSELKPNMSESEYYGKRFEHFFAPNQGYGGIEENVDCESLFGDKNDEKSIAYIVNEVLGYVRVAVPILIILLGSIDLAKATVAGKEDEMKKAQKDFVIRMIAGVAVFFAPQIVAIIMKLADLVWEGLGYSSCGIQ